MKSVDPLFERTPDGLVRMRSRRQVWRGLRAIDVPFGRCLRLEVTRDLAWLRLGPLFRLALRAWFPGLLEVQG